MRCAPPLLLLLGACERPCDPGFLRGSDGNCYPYDGEGLDSGPAWPDSLSYGDPITTLGAGRSSSMVEWMDAVVLDSARGLAVGQGGLVIVDMETGDPLFQQDTERGYRVAHDPSTDTVWVATRVRGIFPVDVSDPLAPQIGVRQEVSGGYEEDIAADGGRVLVGAQEQGAILLDGDGRPLGTLPADYAFGVALAGDRALVADGAVLALWDVSDPSDPARLAEASLPATGRDIAWSGEHVAVAMGGSGVEVFSLQGDALTRTGSLSLPGSAFSVDIDRDLLWIGAWDVVGLAWLGEGGPLMVGHEQPAESAMGLGAGHGKALIADWMRSTVMQAEPGLAGPELDLEERMFLPMDGSAASLTLRNWGVDTLELELEADPGITLSGARFTLGPGERETLRIASTSGNNGQVRYQSNDPDEREGAVRLEVARAALGEVHQDFELQGFTVPDTSTRPYRLSDTAGDVVLLAYWTTW